MQGFYLSNVACCILRQNLLNTHSYIVLLHYPAKFEKNLINIEQIFRQNLVQPSVVFMFKIIYTFASHVDFQDCSRCQPLIQLNLNLPGLVHSGLADTVDLGAASRVTIWSLGDAVVHG